MRLLFVYWAFENQGSGLLIQAYADAARRLGHEVLVYGRPEPRIPLQYTLDVASCDAILFIFEWTTALMRGDNLDWLRLFHAVPRKRRVILDGDGNYNDIVTVDGDYNHRHRADRDRWLDMCESLSDKICQPTLHPLRASVRSFLFYSYNPAWARPLDFSSNKPFTMLYVGHSKFRWRPMSRVLAAIEPVRNSVGRLGVVGHGWAELPAWASPMQMEDAYATDQDMMRRLRVEVLDPVPFDRVVDCMSRAIFNPVLSRPTFVRLRIVTPRFFETPAANTIPLFGLDAAYVQEIYGRAGLDLVMPEAGADQKIRDIVERPSHYAEIVERIREHLAREHSQEKRLEELIEIIEN
jgi:hypothetical protein